jgi:hypothetical protein
VFGELSDSRGGRGGLLEAFGAAIVDSTDELGDADKEHDAEAEAAVAVVVVVVVDVADDASDDDDNGSAEVTIAISRLGSSPVEVLSGT